MNPFEQLDQIYERFFGEATPLIGFLLRSLIFLLVAIVGVALLLGIGIFAF